MNIRFILFPLCLYLGGCSEQSETSSSTKSTPPVVERVEKLEEVTVAVSESPTEPLKQSKAISSALTSDAAVAKIYELPEIKAWSYYIEQKSQGKVHGAILTSSKEPKDLDGKQYWPVDFFESQETHMHRWESFWVRIDGEEIMVDDLADGPISLQEWRDQKKPLERIKS
ncbi:hypothetical protein [Methylomonas koyamae]|uniref:hypothetical protein n=1 Tax=Methylomonas koyamae TaxID=702114 RepID=UPI000AE3FB98|nr:hypothetical protein [Methylomonas koyamae]ATG91894.1 hypothetical protein MKLM6_3709 [Methylomonas koyamae]